MINFRGPAAGVAGGLLEVLFWSLWGECGLDNNRAVILDSIFQVVVGDRGGEEIRRRLYIILYIPYCCFRFCCKVLYLIF